VSVQTQEVVTSDGTTIGYRRLGTGPGLVVLHGSMSSGYNHLRLAELLADRFTVYLPDRRGRGLSGPYRPGDTLDTEVADLLALLEQANVHNVFGVSVGAIICLEAALRGPAIPGVSIHRAAIFEPPMFADAAPARRLLDQLDRELAAGNLARALVTGMKGAQMGPAFLRFVPDGLMARLTGLAMRGEARKPADGYVPMATLAPTLHQDFDAVVRASGPVDRYAAIDASVLLLGGSNSPRYLKDALSTLEKVLPDGRRVTLDGLDHAATWNEDRGGKPAPVAEELRRFFTP
jgi:pimeloyl-ACP methyl ester carboxylesterase